MTLDPKVLPDDFLDGGVGLINDGRDITVAKVLRGLLDTTSVSVSDLRAATEAAGTLGGRHLVGGNWFRWDAESTVNDGTYLVAIKPDEIDSGDPGRFVLDQLIADLSMPISFSTANDAVLFTVPTGVVVAPLEFWWKVTTNFSGGSSSAIGVSSSKASYNTAGDLLGGVAGDVAAALTTTLSTNLGTIGAGFDTLAKRRVFFKAADTIKFNRITSVFTAGVGAVVMRAAIVYT